MKVSGMNPETGEKFQEDIKDIDPDFIESMSVFDIDDEKIKQIIDNLDVSADTKALLYSISKATIKTGEYIIKIGRKIGQVTAYRTAQSGRLHSRRSNRPI